MTNCYTELQDKLGLSITGLSKMILEKNLRLKIEALPRVVDGPTALSVSSDAIWDKQEICCQFDSLSGCSVIWEIKGSL
jgi:hypothetical protein